MGKFIDVLNNIQNKYIENKKLVEDSTEPKEDEKVEDSVKRELNGDIAHEQINNVYYPKMVNLFQVLCSELTNEEFRLLEVKIDEIKGKDYLYNYKKKLIANSAKFKGMKPEELKLEDFYDQLKSGFFHDRIADFTTYLEDLIGPDRCDKIADKALSYDPLKDNYVHDFDSIVKSAKEALSIDPTISEEDKTKYANLLDEINELEFVSRSQDERFPTKCSSLANKVIAASNTKYIKDNNLEDLYVQDRSDINYNPNVIDNEKLIEKRVKYEFKLEDDYKKDIINVYNKMESLGLLDNEFIFEQGTKIYGFQHFYDARESLREAIENKDYKSLEEKKDKFVKEHNNLREMYAYIKEVMNPDYLSFPGNMTNFRTSYVPKDLSTDLPVNASLNGYYYVFSSMKAANIKIEEFIDNPILACKKIVDILYKKDELDNALQGLSREERIMRCFSIRNYPTVRATFRFVENIVCHEKKFNAKNAFEYSLFVGEDDRNTGYNRGYADFFLKDYTDKTLLNLILTHNEDYEFSKLHGEDLVTKDGLHKIKAFDTKAYVDTHDVNVDDLIDYSKKLLVQIKSVKDTGILDLDSNKLNVPFNEDTYNGMLVDYYQNLAMALFNLTKFKDLSIEEFDKIDTFLNKPRELLSDLGFSEKEMLKFEANSIEPKFYKECRNNQKFYNALDKFNAKFGLKLNKDIFSEIHNIDFNQNEFFKEKFVEVFNTIYKNCENTPKTFSDGKLLTDSQALEEFSTEFNNLCKIGLNDLLKNNELSPLETMTNSEKVKMFEKAFGVNRILDVKDSNRSFRDINKEGFANLSNYDKGVLFESANEKINECLNKFDENKEYNADTKKAFLQSYREVYQTMNQIHNRRWFIKMIMHHKQYKQEKKAINDTLSLVSRKLKVEKDVVKQYFSKKTDTLYSGTRKEYEENPQNTKIYEYDDAIKVSKTITKVTNNINNKYNLESEPFDIVLRDSFVKNEVQNDQRKNIENIDLESTILENKVENIEVENKKEKEINK